MNMKLRLGDDYLDIEHASAILYQPSTRTMIVKYDDGLYVFPYPPRKTYVIDSIRRHIAYAEVNASREKEGKACS